MAASPSSEHVPALDGIRGLAILAVIAFHSRVVFTSTAEMPHLVFQLVSQGRLGVTLFFVLSGFLITGILLDTRQSPAYFRRFYFRRVLRIFPLYFAYLFLILLGVRGAWLLATGDDPWRAVNPWWYLAYLQNLPAARASGHLFLNHLWSLAIEEQFYLVWPAIVWLLPRKWLARLCLALFAMALLLRCTLPWDGEAVYRFTLCRVDGLALGAFAAIGYRDFRESLQRWAPRILAASVVPLFLIVALSPSPTWDGAIRTYGESLFVLAAACVVFLARSGQAVGRLCSSSLLRQCGKYSYAMYVLHCAPQWLIEQKLRTLAGPFALVLALKYLYFPVLAAMSFGLARISWRFLESPFLRLKDRAPASVLGRLQSVRATAP
jgi:peptidoglycan/LPS O-acetylase OafA/YrhL